MSDPESNRSDVESTSPEEAIDSSTYEVLKRRLHSSADELQRRLDSLHEARKSAFGSIDFELLTTERVTTRHNCVPRDMVVIGNRLLVGFNVQFGLKTETVPEDVFAVFGFADRKFTEQDLSLVEHPQFAADFRDLYRYYKKTSFLRFAVIGPFLFMVFRVGKSPEDVKTFKWGIEGDRLRYVDNRSDHEYRSPPQHEFEWTRTHRDLHVDGLHPHISIEDRVFVETVGGDLTIKIENNTESGEGIYAEPVDDPDQTLDDAEVYYARVDQLILLKIRPYRESEFRYIVYNEKLQTADRIDSIEGSCVILPEDQGIVFSNGYYLQAGEKKVFDTAAHDMRFDRRIAAPNGEDFLFVFHNHDAGTYTLLPYNIIDQRVENPINGHGHALFENGELILFKGQPEPQKHHALQIWRTPFLGDDAVEFAGDTPLHKIGNRELVRGMAECHAVVVLSRRDEIYADLYVDLVKTCGDLVDSYFWLGDPDCFDLRETIEEIRGTASAAVGEFEKVVAVRRSTDAQVAEVTAATRSAMRDAGLRRFEAIDDFVASLSELRGVRGRIISLRDLRYIDGAVVDALEAEVETASAEIAERCVTFLLDPAALDPYEERVESLRAGIDPLSTVSEAKALSEHIDTLAGELELLIETVSNLKIADATKRTEIVDRISSVFATVNGVRATLRGKTQTLASAEGIAEFNSQIKLLGQSVVNYLDLCDSPEKCDDYLTKVMVQLEEMEGKFAEFDEFVVQLAEKRDEVYTAFEGRKVSLLEKRNKRAASLASAADRILSGIRARVDKLESVDEINGFFAADLLVDKVRDLLVELGDLDDSVKVDEIESRLKTIREDSVRQLKDRLDLYTGGGSLIQLGRHQFSVNTQPLDLTTVSKDGELCLHLTGTDFLDPISDAELTATGDVAGLEVVSESPEVYRGEYLAYQLLTAGAAAGNGTAPTEDWLSLDRDTRLERIQKFMSTRYSEAYTKGVHDQDAERILSAALEIDAECGLLRFASSARAIARLWWNHLAPDAQKRRQSELASLGHALALFPGSSPTGSYTDDLAAELGEFVLASEGLLDEALVPEAAEYLYSELLEEGPFVVSADAARIVEAFRDEIAKRKSKTEFKNRLAAVGDDWRARVRLLRDWTNAFLAAKNDRAARPYADEVAAILESDSSEPEAIVTAPVDREIGDLLGNHPRISEGVCRLDYPEFRARVRRHRDVVAPRFERYAARKREIVDRARNDLKLEEFKPRVLSSFVRNRLIDEVYLPLVGDNLAKQIGAAGAEKRTDLMGLLLVISPPGYGKTTLMEYIASRLGIIFMKVNGPAIGHHVTSLDPAEAPNASAREELEKLNLAFEMGDNVLIYLDDIQHCNPELLQKFISLCDAQRKIEGVFRGRARTYDLRGRKVAVVMAGNPYTESGEKFQIPDMLANRADTYNLGEILGGNEEAFNMSYLENAITSNPVLNPLATRSQKDVYAIIHMAETGSDDGVELEGKYSLEELQEMVSTMKKLLRVRDVILRVNREYIRSAAQADDYRTEPAFKLQGSYRNMNRIAEKVLSVMNDDELEAVIFEAYENDAQTLTTGAEANLLKFKEMFDKLTPEETRRWEEIKRTFQRNLLLGSAGDDKFAQVVAQLSSFNESLASIGAAIGDAAKARDRSSPIASPAGAGAKRRAPRPSPQEIRVVNRIPKVFLNVLEQQFELMRGWLEPLQDESRRQSTQFSHLRERVEESLSRHAELIEDLRRSDIERGDDGDTTGD